MAQCEGDLSSLDCGECVSQVVQKSEVECGGVSSGQVYLDKCYISYNYYPDGVPHGGIGGGDGGIGASYVGLKEELPPCLDWSLGIDELMTGVSFASAGSGFDPLTAQIGGVIPVPQQLSYFKDYLNKLDFTIGKDKRADIIKRAIFVVSAGTNDFISYSTLPLRRQSFSIEGYQGYILQNQRVLLQGLCDL